MSVGDFRETSSPTGTRSLRASQDGAPPASQGSGGSKIITASFELLRAGALPGATVPFKVNIQHTKSIQSPNGVIATLYRQARVDMHPNLPVTSTNPAQRAKKFDDYYPRSRSGLGGLSLSAAGSSQVWRKDLTQSVSPLYIDPQSTATEVRSSIRIPEEAFPTMSIAPGDMIAFKYFIEVVVDVHGKFPSRHTGLSTETSSVHSAPSNLPQPYSDDTARTSEFSTFYYPPPGKGAVKLSCEVVVGTHDESKGKGKERRQKTPAPTVGGTEEYPLRSSGENTELADQERSDDRVSNMQDRYDYYDYDHGYDQRFYISQHYDHFMNNSVSYDRNGVPASNQRYHPPPPPPPDIPEEPELSEKERLRRAEESLLPSRPPGVGQPAPDSQATPSAPFLPGEVYYQDNEMSRNAFAPTADDFNESASRITSSVQCRVRSNSVLDTLPQEHPAPAYSELGPHDAPSRISGREHEATPEPQQTQDSHFERSEVDEDGSAHYQSLAATNEATESTVDSSHRGTDGELKIPPYPR